MKSLFVVVAAFILSLLASHSTSRIVSWLAPSCCSNAMWFVAADDDDEGEDDEDDDDDEDEVEEMMEKVHEGKRSPFGQIKQAIRNEPPRWEVIEKQLPKLVKMSELLRKAENDKITDNADSYLDATTQLGKALKVKDADAVRKAFKSLGESCADCHFKGGVGGELDD